MMNDGSRRTNRGGGPRNQRRPAGGGHSGNGNGGGGGNRGGGRGGGGDSRGSNRGNGGGGSYRGGRGGGGRSHRGPTSSFDSGNQRERVNVESGHIVFIDQFMLANPTFTSRIKKVIDDEPEAKDTVIRDFGGQVVELKPGTYRIDRNPFKVTIYVHPDSLQFNRDEFPAEEGHESGMLFVDTRCLAMIDRELLDDLGLLEKYQQLWFGDQTKACRDLLRDNGGAVRYGFLKSRDDLKIVHFSESDVVCLLP